MSDVVKPQILIFCIMARDPFCKMLLADELLLVSIVSTRTMLFLVSFPASGNHIVVSIKYEPFLGGVNVPTVTNVPDGHETSFRAV